MGRGFASYHQGGIMVGMADGSGRFVAETTSPFAFNAMGSRAAGDTIPQ